MTLRYNIAQFLVVICSFFVVMSAFAVDVPTPVKASKNSIFQPADFPTLGSLKVATGKKVVFDTGTITTGPTVSGALDGNGAIGISQTGKVQLAVFSFDDVNIEAGAQVVVTGDRGLVLLSRDSIVINTTIDLSGTPGGGVNATPGSGGPGAEGGDYGKSTASAPPPSDGGDGGPGMKDNGKPARGYGAGFNQRVQGGTSGGGGAYGGAGGATSEGSGGWGGGVRPMPGGKAYGDQLLTELFGGSGGAGGSNDRNFSSASGGGAGGAISLVAMKSISFGAKAQIKAKGGAGGVNRICGGGGSGGGILVAAPLIKLADGAIVDASGGAGGDGGKAVYDNLKPEIGRRDTGSGGGGGGGRVAFFTDDAMGLDVKLPKGVMTAGGKGGTEAKDGGTGSFYKGSWAEANQNVQVKAALQLENPTAISAQLVKLANDTTDQILHDEVLNALALQGDAGDASLLTLAGNPASPARLAALKRVKPMSVAAFDMLEANSKENIPAIVEETMHILSIEGGARAQSIIAAGVNSKMAMNQGYALSAALNCKTLEKPLITALSNVVASGTDDNQIASAMEALAGHKVPVKYDATVIPRLLKLMENPNNAIARSAAEAIGRLEPPILKANADIVIPNLILMLGRGDADTAYAASDILARIGKPAVKPVMVAVRNVDSNIGRRAIITLGKLGAVAVEAIPLIKTMAEENKDKYWQSATTNALLILEKVPVSTGTIRNGFVWVPAGKFLMGTPVDFKEAHDPDECPQRTVELTHGFWIGRCEVTNAEYALFLADLKRTGVHAKCNPKEPKDKDHTPAFWDDKNLNAPNQPVVGVDWWDAYAYAAWAGKRLPTEAEWEYAARGTDGRKFPWGDTWPPVDLLGNFADEPAGKIIDGLGTIKGYKDGFTYTAPVGSFPAGASWCGAQDMAGNVWEWCNDRYDVYDVKEIKDPIGSTTAAGRVVRGGSWRSSDPTDVRCGFRDNYEPAFRDDCYGFRVASSETTVTLPAK